MEARLTQVSKKLLAIVTKFLRKRHLNILCHRGRPFHYIARDGSRFICIPTSATSTHEREQLVLRGSRAADRHRWLSPGDACFDLGANIGFMTASFAARVGSKGLVVSVEPSPATHGFLRQAMHLLGHRNIRFEPVCVADHSGSVAFYGCHQRR
jgi:hypothetical protein